MNVLKVYEDFKKNWDHLDFTLEDGATEDSCVITTEMEAKNYFTDHILVRAFCFADGTNHVLFIFDKIKKTTKVYDLINELNSKTSWIKGYISTLNGEDFFEVHYNYFDAKDENNMVGHLNHAMTDLLSEDILRMVREICKYTY